MNGVNVKIIISLEVNTVRIEVSTYKNIPKDYEGLMGVPYNFVNHMSKEQFEAVDIKSPKVNGKKKMLSLKKFKIWYGATMTLGENGNEKYGILF